MNHFFLFILLCTVVFTTTTTTTTYAQTSCPIVDFSDPNPAKIIDGGIAGNNIIEEGDVYLFQDVVTSSQVIYAELKIEKIVDAILQDLDDNNSNAQRFQPVITPPASGRLAINREGYVQFSMRFIMSDQSLVPIKQLRFTGFDMDAEVAVSEPFDEVHETAWITGGSASFNTPTDLTDAGIVSEDGVDWKKILGPGIPHTGISNDPNISFNTVYGESDAIHFRLGYFYDRSTIIGWPKIIGDFSLEFSCFNPEDIVTPVKFKSFTASRNNTLVQLAWTTASEQNNRGFNVQHNIEGTWKNIAFVPSKAINGNSSGDLYYQHTYVNTESRIAQYRIQQIDNDGQTSFSEICAVRGQGGDQRIIIFPNPAAGGKVNIKFEDGDATKEVLISDMQGKLIKKYSRATGNFLIIDNLATGFYTIKVTSLANGSTYVEKVLIR